MEEYATCLQPQILATIKEFIVSHWDETVREAPVDSGTLLALPYPYTVPCRQGTFQELYYWDTYFTCLGLVESGRPELAIFNAKNLLSLVERFGYIPNGNRTFYLTHSQPPFLGPLVAYLAGCPGGELLLPESLPLLRREYEFWATQRSTPVGLARYGHHANREQLLGLHESIAQRARLASPPESVLPELSHTMAECESGWDFNPRFGGRCEDFCAVDLNCLLYLYKRLFAENAGPREEAYWGDLAARRVTRLNELCWDEERGGFFDYNHVHGRRGEIVSCATFYALWAGLAEPKQAAKMVSEILPQLEFAFGLAACGKRSEDRWYQWDYPNGWACLHHIIATGLKRYGYFEAAKRIAQKYCAAVSRSFQDTGDLWEKYNVEDGSPFAFAEAGYASGDTAGIPTSHQATPKPPAMMGWTAGVFLALMPLAIAPTLVRNGRR